MVKLVEIVVSALVTAIVKSLTPEKVEKVADKALDWCKTAVEKTKTDLDNEILLPLIDIVREAFQIEHSEK